MYRDVFGWAYPAGAEHDPNAPYNQVENEPVKVDVEYSCIMRKSTTVQTSDYIAEPWEDCEPDGEGGYSHTGGTDYDFSDTDFADEYSGQHYTPLELISKFRDLLQKLLNKEDVNISECTLINLISECEGWESEEELVEED